MSDSVQQHQHFDNILSWISVTEYTWCFSESGDFAKLFFLDPQRRGGCRYRHFAANFKAF
jgi:hypothetical protein